MERLPFRAIVLLDFQFLEGPEHFREHTVEPFRERFELQIGEFQVARVRRDLVR